MEQTKIEVSKPILSPTRSLDEGFESDPDRISTDSDLTSNQTFDHHHHHENAAIIRHSADASPISIRDDGGESESDNNADDVNVKLNATIKTDHSTTTTKTDQKQQQQQNVYRRMKNKAPLPPKSNSTNSIYQTTQPRSQSVDRIQQRSSSEFNKSSISSNTNQNILAGRFVRVAVDPKQQYLNYFKNYKSYQNYHTNNNNNSSSSNSNSNSSRLLPIAATGSTSNLYKSYHTSSSSLSNSNSKSSISNLQQPNSHEMPSGGLLSLSNLSSSMMPIQYGYSTVKAPKNYLHFSHHHHHHHLQHHPHLQQQQQQPQSIQQSHFLASSCWTQSMDPRKARK